MLQCLHIELPHVAQNLLRREVITELLADVTHVGSGDIAYLAVERIGSRFPLRRALLGAKGRAQAATWPTEADTLAQVEAVYEELLS